MADRDQGRIEVQLSLLSGRDTAAAEALAKSVGQIAEAFKALQSTDYQQTAENLAKLHAKMANDTQRLIDEGKAMQQRGQGEGGRSFIERTRQRLADVIGPDQSQGATERADKAKEEAAQAHKQYQEKQQQGVEQQRRSQSDLTAEQQKANIRRAKANVPLIGSEEDNPKGWYNAPGGPLSGAEVDPMTGEPTGSFRIPRFGRLTPQDYLNMIRDRSLKKVQQRANQSDFADMDPDEQREALKDAGGKRYQLASRLSNLAGFGYSAWYASQVLGKYMPTQFDDAGAQLGYTRDTGSPLPSHIFGFQTPFSAAGAEGWRQQRDTMLMRMMPGINSEQAGAITQATANAGFSGNMGAELRRNFFAPAFQRWGVNPNEIAPFTQALRTGTAGIADLNRAISDLGDVSRAANMNVSQTVQAMNQVAEATQQMGGTYMQGLDYARTFQAGTGLPAEIGAKMSDNPIVQGFVAARTGMPAFAQGALPAVTRMRANREALAQMVSAYEGSMGGFTETVRDASGDIVARPHMSGHQAAIAGAAQQLGLTYEQARKMLNTGSNQNTVETAGAMIDDYEQRTRRAARGGGQMRAERRQAILNKYSHFKHKNLSWNDKGEMVDDDGKVVLGRDEVSQMGNQWALEKTGGKISGGTGWDELVATAKKIGVNPDKLKSAGKKADYHDRANTVRHLIQDKVASNKVKYQIGFTGDAERFFKVLAKKTDTDYPDGPRNARAAKAKGPSGLGDDLKTAGAALWSADPQAIGDSVIHAGEDVFNDIF